LQTSFEFLTNAADEITGIPRPYGHGHPSAERSGPAALFFAAVVVVTMLAAMSFDPRLIWDVKEKMHE